MTIFCYGDSNTYGYDPRGAFGGRYAPEDRWCDLLAEQLHCTTVNFGENGRTIPTDHWSRGYLCDRIQQAESDLLLIMLGSNDVLLMDSHPESVTRRMEALLDSIRAALPDLPIVLLSAPQVRIPGCTEVMADLSRRYAQAAAARHISFIDTCAWPIPLAHDGVHFSEPGHHVFAENLAQALKKLPEVL